MSAMIAYLILRALPQDLKPSQITARLGPVDRLRPDQGSETGITDGFPKRLQLRPGTLRDQLHTAVGKIPHRPADVKARGDVPRCLAEADTLDGPLDPELAMTPRDCAL